jgi:hypothetical protein
MKQLPLPDFCACGEPLPRPETHAESWSHLDVTTFACPCGRWYQADTSEPGAAWEVTRDLGGYFGREAA